MSSVCAASLITGALFSMYKTSPEVFRTSSNEDALSVKLSLSAITIVPVLPCSSVNVLPTLNGVNPVLSVW